MVLHFMKSASSEHARRIAEAAATRPRNRWLPGLTRSPPTRAGRRRPFISVRWLLPTARVSRRLVKYLFSLPVQSDTCEVPAGTSLRGGSAVTRSVVPLAADSRCPAQRPTRRRPRPRGLSPAAPFRSDAACSAHASAAQLTGVSRRSETHLQRR